MFILNLASILLGGLCPSPSQATPEPSYRWFQLEVNLQQPAELDKAVKAIDDAAAAGYNGVIFKDPTLQSGSRFSPAYVSALTKVTGEAKKTNIEFIPSIAPIGSASGLLQGNLSLAEAMPYKNVHFTVTGGHLKPSDPLPPVTNGGFDTFAGDLPTGFKAAAHPGVAAFQDTAMKHGGAASLRVEAQAAIQPANTVMYEQALIVQPWHQYRLGIWTKTLTAPTAKVTLKPLSPAGVLMAYHDWPNTPDWAKSVMVFNSQDNSTINIQLLVQPMAANAKVWIDDLTIEDVGILNITRRDDCPLVIRGDDGAIYNEYVDVDDVNDKFVPPGSTTPQFDITHDPKPITVLGNSRLKETQQIVLDYYAAILVDNKPTLCFNSPTARSILRNEVRRVIALTHPHFVFFDVKDVMALGWDPACEATGKTTGEMLADFLKNETENVKSIDSKIQVATYTNMYDPNANSKDSYFYARGGTSGSIIGVPKGTIFLNDNFASGVPSLGYFARLGYSQILLGFFDNADGVPTIDKWEKTAVGTKNILGFGYISPKGDYSHLSDFAHTAASVAH